MSGEKVRVAKDGAITTVTINRPERRNAVDIETGKLLLAAFLEFDADETQSVAILRSTGPVFCAGFDLKSLSGTGIDYDAVGDGAMGPSRRLLSKPVIAAVEGYAVAGGLELALWCDLRVAARSASFGVFCRRWGVPLIDGGTVRLPRLIGHSRALDMILTGREVKAQEALEMGLANRLVEDGEAYDEARRLAEQLCQFPQTCMRVDRMTSYRQWGMDLADALTLEGVEGEKPLQEEARKGASRFASGLGRSGDFSSI
ncbi:crotonase/enoyl-CoA hydratase family protein [Sneathiella chinensis]|uniref:Enoyl-CoA hydratase n=1 Tax=Sneathiella chinensis TaxID=349750 RepID=A0ABQ5U6N6_9PROT|nr:crotonase/enoyl-CoA hydratase family protein [Sneathiella chinensis]GLQ06924.1 enoyl-CoA hydratase [Sneathiella chinensis]